MLEKKQQDFFSIQNTQKTRRKTQHTGEVNENASTRNASTFLSVKIFSKKPERGDFFQSSPLIMIRKLSNSPHSKPHRTPTHETMRWQ